MFKRLLAKSLPPQDSDQPQVRGAATYTGHIGCVMTAADVLVDQLGEVMLQQLGLEGVDLSYFVNTVRLGAYLHDWGKANQHFQEMVYLNSLDSKSQDEQVFRFRKRLKAIAKEHPGGQMLRHEVVSGLLALQVRNFREWLECCPRANLIVAVWAAMGHHLKLEGQSAAGVVDIPDGTGQNLRIYTQHDDFRKVLKMGSKWLGLPEKLPQSPPEDWPKVDLERELKALRREFLDYEETVDGDQQRFIAAVKATVIAADLAGSALPFAEENLQGWIRKVLNLTLTADELQELIDQRLEGKPLRQFQKQVAHAPHRVTLVKAGCGMGKTAGSYAWAKQWAEGRKLFFSYPTTGTASQGYIDYANGTQVESDLMHSRADLDRELLFSGERDDSEGMDARLAAFQAWRKQLIICTVDSVLGLMQNNRRPLYAWPAIAQSAFVFDEVHAYDDRLFGALLQFLRTFRGAPILLMSASFPPGRLQRIQEVMAELGEEIDAPVEGPKELETLKRYEIQSVDAADKAWDTVLHALNTRQKVLWVTNSVQTCIDIYRQAKDQIGEHLPELGIQPLIYHSRYRYIDRVKKHEAVINAFRADEPVLAITTQVCEMSLDISADLLISAMAPAAALVQRLGRLNRRMIRTEEGTRLAIIYPWDNDKPYEVELDTGKQLIERVSDQATVSQQDLSEIISELGGELPEAVRSAWLEGNWCTYPDFLRKGGYTITVLLQEDLGAIRQHANENDKTFMKAAQGWSVPIRIPQNLRNWKRCRFYPIAPPDELIYSEETGAEQHANRV